MEGSHSSNESVNCNDEFVGCNERADQLTSDCGTHKNNFLTSEYRAKENACAITLSTVLRTNSSAMQHMWAVWIAGTVWISLVLRIEALGIGVHVAPQRKSTSELRTKRPTDHSDGGDATTDVSPMKEEPDSIIILDLLRPSAQCDATQMSGTHLAYIGDCVYELFVRSKLVWPSKKTVDMQQQVVSLVNGK
jgi:hypothetical protein